jgi:hypothetical protein
MRISLWLVIKLLIFQNALFLGGGYSQVTGDWKIEP